MVQFDKSNWILEENLREKIKHFIDNHEFEIDTEVWYDLICTSLNTYEKENDCINN